MSFAIGSLVKARGREWVVLPDPRNDDDLLIVRPLVGTDDEVTGLYLPAEDEPVVAAGFPPPDPESDLGNHHSGGLLRDALRLALRSAAGPLRSLGQIAVEPRPYQLVPLLMALRLDPVRLLIADDVGIGKSVEAGLIARELIDRGEIASLSVLCPPHLAEQWQRTLRLQFQIEAALVLPSTVRRLERQAGLGSHESLFAHYRHTVVSLDYIKSERHRHLFLQDASDLVIVDEAHTCASSNERQGGRHQRHELLRALVEDSERHLLLVTATPHSGKDGHFRSLLALLDPELADLELTGEANRKHRQRLARHLVQRRRGDLERYLDEDTPFPKRESFEHSYHLTPEYRRRFDEVLVYCRERVVSTDDLGSHQQRVRWWAALALLRALASSPAAAAASLRNRSASADTTTVADADAVGRRTVFDLEDETHEGTDVAPGGQVVDADSDDAEEQESRRQLFELADRIESLGGDDDPKLMIAVELVRDLVQKGFSPIVFCRFIPTVDYVAKHLAKRLYGVTVVGVTGESHPKAREDEVEALGRARKRVLVCTDCLSEGINLQHHFDAVLHYDLSWNPTRHEQRDGRVDRYAQPSPTVRTITFFGEDNPIDGIVLRVLLRKHEQIRRDLDVSVPVPIDSREVLEAMFEGLVLREEHASHPEQLNLDFIEEGREAVARRWDLEARRERRSRSLFAQNTINEKEVAAELAEARAVLGDAILAQDFLRRALPELGGVIVEDRGAWNIDLAEAPRALRDAAGGTQLVATLDAEGGSPRLVRAHPLVRATADYVWQAALDSQIPGPARRCGVIRTQGVATRTTLLLLRLRFHLGTRDRRGQALPLLAEEVAPAAFAGTPERARWLDDDATQNLLDLEPDENTLPDLARRQLRQVLVGLPALRQALIERAQLQAQHLLDAHRRVREATSRRRGLKVTVEPRLADGDPPVDLLGVYVYLPLAGGGR